MIVATTKHTNKFTYRMNKHNLKHKLTCDDKTQHNHNFNKNNKTTKTQQHNKNTKQQKVMITKVEHNKN